jgi:hypothetical protein
MNDINQITENTLADLDITILSVPGKQTYSLGKNCQDVMANGINLKPFIKFCHATTGISDLPTLLAAYLKATESR